MRRWTRTGVSASAYRKALCHPDRPWAQRLITDYGAQRKTERKLEGYQIENLRTWTPAELAFARILREQRIYYVREHGFNCRNGKDYFADFYIRHGRVIFEIDGGIHNKQQNYDAERDIAIMQDFRIPIIRFTNEEVLKETERVRLLVTQIIRDHIEEYQTKRSALRERQEANKERKRRAEEFRRNRRAARKGAL